MTAALPSTTWQIGPIEKKQAKSLLKMIDDNISENNGKYYTNDMYIEAEKILKQREEEIEKERQEKRK